jgi:hypothetical protein
MLEKPDIALVDIRLPPSFRDEGVRAALELRRLVVLPTDVVNAADRR